MQRYIHISTHLLPGMLLALLLAACASSRQQAITPSAKRDVAVTDESLKSEAMLIDAKMKSESERYAEAEVLYRDILRMDPHNDAACYELGRLLAARGMMDSAIAYVERAQTMDYDNVWYSMMLATFYRHLSQWPQYIATWNKIVDQHPDKIDYYFELADGYLQNNDHKNAIATLNRVEKIVGVSEEVSLRKAKIWEAVGNKSKAVAEMEALSASLPDDVTYASTLASYYMNDGRYDKAIEALGRVRAANPADAYVNISLAECYKAKKQHAKAFDYLREAFVGDKLSTSTKVQLLTNFYSEQEFYGTQSQYSYKLMDAIMESADDSTAFALFYGYVLMHQDKHREATRQFRLALTVDSSRYETWQALLYCQSFYPSNTDTVIDEASRAAALFPLQPYPYITLALANMDKGNFGEALKAANRLLQLGVDNDSQKVQLYMIMAECYSQMDDERCYTYFDKALAVTPDDANVLNSYAYRLAVDGRDLDRALQMSRRSLKAQPDNKYFLDTYGWILHRMGNDGEAARYIHRAIQQGDNSDEVLQHWETVRHAYKE